MNTRPILWHIEISHFNEKARWALDLKGVAHELRALVPGYHIAVALALMWIGARMQTHIRDLMRTIWKQPTGAAEPDTSWIHDLRSAGAYRAFWYAAMARV